MKDLIVFSLFLIAAAMAAKADQDRAADDGGFVWQNVSPLAVAAASR